MLIFFVAKQSFPPCCNSSAELNILRQNKMFLHGHRNYSNFIPNKQLSANPKQSLNGLEIWLYQYPFFLTCTLPMVLKNTYILCWSKWPIEMVLVFYLFCIEQSLTLDFYHRNTATLEQSEGT